MKEREGRQLRGRIILSPSEMERIWQMSYKYAVEQCRHKYEIEIKSRCYFAGLVAIELVKRSEQLSFSIRDMEGLFGVSEWRQKWLIRKGLSPARLQEGHPFYLEDGAIRLLTLMELTRFYRFRYIVETFGEELAKENFVYWTVVDENLGQIYPHRIRISGN